MYGAYGIRARSGMYELARLEGSGMAVPKHLQSLPAGKNNLRPAARPLSWQGGLARSGSWCLEGRKEDIAAVEVASAPVHEFQQAEACAQAEVGPG
eukprot:1161895-Pelagomonas_calceolata.AAC.5